MFLMIDILEQLEQLMDIILYAIKLKEANGTT